MDWKKPDRGNHHKQKIWFIVPIKKMNENLILPKFRWKIDKKIINLSFYYYFVIYIEIEKTTSDVPPPAAVDWFGGLLGGTAVIMEADSAGPERPYQCSYCPKRYLRKNNLDDHILTDHPNSDKVRHFLVYLESYMSSLRYFNLEKYT